MKLEIFRGADVGIGTLAAGQWEEIQATSPEVQTGGARGVFAGGFNPGFPHVNTIDYITIATAGNAIDFGYMTNTAQMIGAGCASRTRGVFGNVNPSADDTLNVITIASTGNAADYGNLTVGRRQVTQFSNSTRGISAGGATPSVSNVIDYFTISQNGNAVDFGDCTHGGGGQQGSCASSTKGVLSLIHI